MAWDLPVLALCLWHSLWWISQILWLCRPQLVSFTLCTLPTREAEKACHSHSSLKHIRCPKDKCEQTIWSVSGVKHGKGKKSPAQNNARPATVRVPSHMISCYPSCAQEHREGKLHLLSSPTLSSPAPDFCIVDAGFKLVGILISGAVWAAQFVL